MNRTKIEYLTHTWNPIAMRCTPVSEGCAHCWHLAMARRMAANPKLPQAERKAYAGGPPVLRERELDSPLRLKKPAVIGVQFMGDLFHEDVSVEMIAEVFFTMWVADWHTLIILTKRAKRMYELVSGNELRDAVLRLSPFATEVWPLPNVWLGVPVENQATADERIRWLQQTLAAKHVVSYEPMLGPVDWGQWVFPQSVIDGYDEVVSRFSPMVSPPGFLGRPVRIDWLIAGGETGPRARPMHPDWARAARDACQKARVPFFFKHWGEWSWASKEDWRLITTVIGCPPADRYYQWPAGSFSLRVGHKRAGRLLDGRTWEQRP